MSTAEEEPEVLVEELGLSHLGCLVLEGDSLYYTALETTPGLVKLPLTGGQPHVLASDVGDACFVLHQDTFYLAAPGDPVDDGPDSRILSVPLVGGAPTVLAEGVDADKLAVQGSRIFMLGLGDAGITWIPIAGGTPVQLLDDPDPYIKDFVVDHENVYYAAGDEWNRATEVKSVPLGGGEPVIMADCGNLDRIHALGQDDVSIYVSFGTRTEEDEHHVLDRIPKDGGEATHVGTWMGGRPHMIHVTETHVYVSEDWVGEGFDAPWEFGCDSRVMVAPIDGGELEVVAKEQNSPGGMATNMGYVYWRNRGRGWPGDITDPETCGASQVVRTRAP